jgi:hypothetical protein
MDLVQDYSFTRSTKPVDKLVALSGIAKLTSVATCGTYVAGFWRETIEKDLLWYNREKLVPTNLSHPPHAPTWSWASLDSPISIIQLPIDPRGAYFGEMLIQVSDVGLQYASEDAMGRVTSGWLEVVGQLRPISLSMGFDRWNQLRWLACIDESAWEPLLSTRVFLDLPTDDPLYFEEANEECKLFYIPVACTVPAVGSLLLRVVDIPGGVFERIGITYLDFPDEDRNLGDDDDLNIHGAGGDTEGVARTRLTMLADLDEELKKSLPCLRYEDGLHTIRII